jgi:GxxExxY protein
MMNAITKSDLSGTPQRRDAEGAEITEKIIGAAIEVHRTLGPGLLESVYEAALCREFELRKISFIQQSTFSVKYKGAELGQTLRIDILVENYVVLEIKAVEKTLPVHKAQLLSYLRLTGHSIGLVINFHVVRLIDGLSRISLSSQSSAYSAPLR